MPCFRTKVKSWCSHFLNVILFKQWILVFQDYTLWIKIYHRSFFSKGETVKKKSRGIFTYFILGEKNKMNSSCVTRKLLIGCKVTQTRQPDAPVLWHMQTCHSYWDWMTVKSIHIYVMKFYFHLCELAVWQHNSMSVCFVFFPSTVLSHCFSVCHRWATTALTQRKKYEEQK